MTRAPPSPATSRRSSANAPPRIGRCAKESGDEPPAEPNRIPPIGVFAPAFLLHCATEASTREDLHCGIRTSHALQPRRFSRIGGRSDFAARDNAWLRLFASKTAPSIARWAASWRSHQSRGPQSSGHAKHHQRHIIVLGSTRSERLCGAQDSPRDFQGRKPMTCFCELDQSLFAPLFVARVHGFGNSVCKEHHQVGCFKSKDASLIPVW